MRFTAVLLTTLFFVVTASADTYYVSPAGDDSASGGSSAPWKTLQFATGNLEAGDTLIVRAGDYAGFVMGWDFPQNGTPTARITVRAEAGARIVERNPRTPDGINLEGASYVTIDGFTVNGMPRAGIRSVMNDGVEILNNSLDSNGRWGILTGFSNGSRIEGNTASRSVAEHGIYLGNSTIGGIIRRNTLFGNNACGIHLNGDLSQGGNGLITGVIIERNIIYDNGRGGGSGINGDGIQNSVIQNNLLFGNHASGISLYKIDAAQGSKNNLVVNNTVVMPADGRWAVNITGGSTGNTIVNNILLSLHAFRGAISLSTDSRSGFISSSNLLADRMSNDGGTSVIPVSEWRAVTNQDRLSAIATVDDTFVDPGASDYRPKEVSRAIDSADSAIAPADDLLGNARPSGDGPDRGAYEIMVAEPDPEPTVEPTPQPTSTPTPEPTATSAPTATPVPTISPTVPPTATATPTPRATATSSPRDTTAPVVSLVNPAKDATVLPFVPFFVKVAASDDVGVKKVEILVDGDVECRDLAVPYVCVIPGPRPGRSIRVQARATDKAGNIGRSGVVRVTGAGRGRSAR